MPSIGNLGARHVNRYHAQDYPDLSATISSAGNLNVVDNNKDLRIKATGISAMATFSTREVLLQQLFLRRLASCGQPSMAGVPWGRASLLLSLPYCACAFEDGETLSGCELIASSSILEPSSSPSGLYGWRRRLSISGGQRQTAK